MRLMRRGYQRNASPTRGHAGNGAIRAAGGSGFDAEKPQPDFSHPFRVFLRVSAPLRPAFPYLTRFRARQYPRMMPDLDRTRTRLPPLGLIFAAWLVPALLSGFNSYMQDRLERHPVEWRWVLFNSIDWLLYAVLTPFVFRMSRRFPLQPPHVTRHVAIHVAGALGMCVAWAG